MLPPTIHAELERICNNGNELLEGGDFQSALAAFQRLSHKGWVAYNPA